MKKKKMKILFITRSFPPTIGGMENFSFGLYTHLNKIEKVKLISNKRSYMGLLPFSIITFVYTLLFSYKYDLVYCNDILTCQFAFPAKIFHRKPMISTLFGLDLNFVLKGNVAFITKMLKRIYRLVIYFPKYYVDEFIPISQGTAQLAKNLGISTSRIINPGIEKTKLHITKSMKKEAAKKIRNRYKFDERKKILLFLGRIIKRKGLHWFLEKVFPKLRNKYQFIVAGSGKEIDDVKRIISKYNLHKNVNLLGRVSNELKRTLFVGSDIFILPNIKVNDHWEGFGMVAIEASKYGTPVVAAALEGITSSVIPYRNGLLFEPGSEKDCIEKINKVSQWGVDSCQISKFTNSQYSNERLAQLYSKAFRSILS